MPVDEVSIGDYVLAGGEAAVAVIVEAVCRLLPGVLGNEQSHSDDSFGGTGGAMSGLLEGPVYTRPRTWRELDVPDVLLSGNHRAIARWQRDEALRRTAANRPDLIRRLAAAADGLDKRDRQVLAEAGFPVDAKVWHTEDALPVRALTPAGVLPWLTQASTRMRAAAHFRPGLRNIHHAHRDRRA